MSSILKALKKLEKEQKPPDEDQSIKNRVDTKKVVNQRAKGTWLFNRILLTASVILILIVIGMLSLIYQSDLKRIFSPKAISSKPTQEEKKLVSQAIQKVPSLKPMPVDRKEPSSVKHEGTPEKGPPPKAFPVERVPTPGTIEKPRPSSTGKEDEAVEKQPVMQGGVDESRYKLEAIVWSNNPDSRFAVINGRIVRPGGTIEGVSVTHIGRDYVAVKSREGEGKLRFTIE
ncbi:MAG: hypothetical protein ABII26_09165 [Pseudomonadota bacterium]